MDPQRVAGWVFVVGGAFLTLILLAFLAEIIVGLVALRHGIRIARRRRGAGNRAASQPLVAFEKPPPVQYRAEALRLPFGTWNHPEYEGLTLGDLARRDPQYVRWLSRYAVDPQLRWAAGVVIRQLSDNRDR